MKFKKGVIMDVSADILPALWAAEKVWMKLGRPEGVTVTSARDGRHSWGSKHYSGLALDFRVRYWDKATAQKATKMVRDIVGDDFDIVLEWDKIHVHAEYHPKRL